MDPWVGRACDSNYWQANAAFFGLSRTGAFAESHDLVLWHCGFPLPAFNRAFLKSGCADLPAALAAAERHFEGLALPFMIECREDFAVENASTLGAAGYRSAGTTPAMVLDPIRAATGPAVPDLVIADVTTPADLAAFQATAFRGFGLPERAGPRFLTEQLHGAPQVTLLLGRLAGEPVCTAACVQTGWVAGIYWVATLAEQRGRGLGEAVTWAAVNRGVASGCRVASLQATDLGAPVYRRMGFDTPMRYAKLARGES